MPNKQISDLPPLDSEVFRPARDNFIVQKPNGMTTRSDIGNMIDDPSINLPGSTNWNWNFLDKPATIVPYHKIDYGLPAFNDLSPNAVESDVPTSSAIGYPSMKNVSYEYDAITRKPTGIPKNAKSLMCIAFLNNCDLYLIGPRASPLVASQKLPTYHGFNSLPVEGIFIVDNISRPRNSEVNQNTEGKTIEYMEPNTLSFELRFRLGNTSWVSFGGSYSLLSDLKSAGASVLKTLKGGLSYAGNLAAQAVTGLDRAIGFLPNGSIGGVEWGVDFRDSYAGQALNELGGIVDQTYAAFGSGSKNIDAPSSDLVNKLKEIASYPADLFKSASDTLAKGIEKIPIIGAIIAPLIGTREGMDLVNDRIAMARILNDPRLFYEYFIHREVILETNTQKAVAGWELFYIKVIAWN